MSNKKIILITGCLFLLSLPVFSQSTPPLEKPIGITPAEQLSEPGRIQNEMDEKRNETNSPDSDANRYIITPSDNVSKPLNQLEKDSGINQRNFE
ncbi:hypothetical protein [Nitrosomonas ureae]|uniref:Uncharacterized protein n=1 Tax=Nitrosomonas ureae TaxID=44577 RepID=A0A1H5Y0K5_9PROT|nr:hypothetical protein [Nitrosomonas ureae]SEG17463.1 hypothetical protein SAMN05216334_1354 [Nitrosomonas ureae]